MTNLLRAMKNFVFVTSLFGILCVVNIDGQAAPADDLKVSQLEQEVRELQRVVQQQTRRIESLENGVRQSRLIGAAPPRTALPDTIKNIDAVLWRQRANWDKLRIGMSEAEVLNLLGPPTTMRKSKEGETQTLFYASELEAGGFLSGDVILADRRVADIHKPVLK